MSETKPIEILQFLVNLALAVIGGIALFIYWRQLGEMVKQYPELQKSATAADVSAKALKDQLRAQVGFTEFKVSYEPNLGEIVSQCAIKNAGQTAALNVQIDQVFLTDEKLAAKDTGLVYMWPPLPERKPHLDPHGTLLLPANEERGCLTRQDRLSPESVIQYPMIFYVSWKDVNGAEWTTGRCLEYQPKFREYFPCLFDKFAAIVQRAPVMRPRG